MAFRVSKRQEPWKWGSCFIFPAAVGLSLGLSALLLAALGKPPLTGLALLFDGAFGSGYVLTDALRTTVPLFLCSLGVAVAFRMQIWNIGAEGQYALGAVGAAWAALSFPQLPALALLPLMLTAGAVCGMLWALVPAWLKTRWRVNEIITTLMLNYIGILLLDYLVYGPWKDPASFGFPMTQEFVTAAILPRIPGTRLHWGLILCVLLAVGVHVLMNHTRLGYELRASGSGPRASRYARMPYNLLVLFVMAVCGALAGIAGFVETSATVGRLQPGVMAGYGYTAIIVAWLARLNPLGIAVASFLLAALRVGVENLQLELQVPAAFGQIIEGLVLLTVLSGQFFLHYQLRRTSFRDSTPNPARG